jgi:hypothetical protein
MHRTFEELGVTVKGVAYGQFTGEVQFDATGSVVQIDVECQNFGGSALTLDIEELVRDRIRLRRKWGLGFLEEGSAEVTDHARMFVLFQALAETIEKTFADDIRQYVEDARTPESERWSA